MNVFVSCTTKDLGKFRDLICDKPSEWWGSERNVPRLSSMGGFKAEDIPPVDWSIRQASNADVVVLLLGRYHGALAENPDSANSGVDIARLRRLMDQVVPWRDVRDPPRFSYTQWEILGAMAGQVPVLVFSPDKNSTDADLCSCWQGAEPEDEWLRHRHELFSDWIRSCYTEDHFKNRADLLNRVRAALKRRQAQGRRRRSILLLAVLVLVLAVGTVLGHAARTAAVKRQGEKKAAADAQRENAGRASAVALGSSLAMLGQSSASTGRLVFERSLGQLGFPDNQVSELCDTYTSFERRVVSGTLAYDDAVAEIRTLVETRLRVLTGERLTPYMRLGYCAAHLALLLQFWEELSSQGDVLTRACSALDALKEAVQSADFPRDLAARIQGIDRAQLAEARGRETVREVVEDMFRLYQESPP